MITKQHQSRRTLRRVTGGLAAVALATVMFGAGPASAQEPLSIDLQINPEGTIDTRTGDITITGTITCTESADFTQVSAEARQRLGREFIRATGFEFVQECEGEVPFEIELQEQGVFTPGRITVEASAFGCEFETFECDFDDVTTVVRLRPAHVSR